MTGESLRVVVSPRSALETNRGLFADLEPLLPVTITPTGGRDDGDAFVILDVDRSTIDSAVSLGFPVYSRVGSSAELRRPGTIRFTPSLRLDARLRGQQFAMSSLAVVPVHPRRGDHVMAFAGSDPVWVERSVNGHIVDIVGIQPVVDDGVPGAEHLMSVLPLVHFLRRLVERPSPVPAIRACFLLDDPNLRWWSYGYLRYRELAAHAAAHNYHVSISMIPLDALVAHPKVVEFIKAHPEEYSLSMQGNNHTHRELARTSSHVLLSSAAQAVRRVERFERRTGLPVDRVVVPPHGGLSTEGLQAESAVGLDAVAASPWSIPPGGRHGGIGLQPTVSGPDGLAILIRRHLNEYPAWIAMDAYLNRPLIVYLHHEDLRSGLSVLAEAAERINQLGDVTWCSLGDMLQTQYTLTTVGDRAEVCLYSPQVRLTLPDHVRSMVVVHSAPGATSTVHAVGAGIDAELQLGTETTIQPGAHLSLQLGRRPVDLATIAWPRWTPWPVVRRLMTETRDRLQPVIRR